MHRRHSNAIEPLEQFFGKKSLHHPIVLTRFEQILKGAFRQWIRRILKALGLSFQPPGPIRHINSSQDLIEIKMK